MVSNYAVCHNFANNEKVNLRSDNVFWAYDWNTNNIRTIYSYGHHFAMSRIYENEKVCLFTFRGYSNTTSHHLSDCICAIDTNYYKLIRIYDPAGSIGENLKQYEKSTRKAGSTHHGLTCSSSRLQSEARVTTTSVPTAIRIPL